MDSHSDVIGAFGGSRPLAEAIGVEPKIAIHWPKRGIPARYWHRVADAAAAKGLTLTPHDLERLPPSVEAIP